MNRKRAEIGEAPESPAVVLGERSHAWVNDEKRAHHLTLDFEGRYCDGTAREVFAESRIAFGMSTRVLDDHRLTGAHCARHQRIDRREAGSPKCVYVPRGGVDAGLRPVQRDDQGAGSAKRFARQVCKNGQGVRILLRVGEQSRYPRQLDRGG